MRLGICLPLRGFGAAEAVELCVEAERLGYDSVWVSELASYDAFAVACAIAVRTERIRIGTAIVPVTTRTPALHAMSYSAFGDLAPGRAIVGYGMSTPTIVEGWHGQPMPGAVPATTDLWRILDQAMSGEKTEHEGKALGSRGFRLEAPTQTPPKRYLGALGPRMRAFAREHADGLILNFAPRSSLAGIVERERAAGGEAGRRGYEFTLPIRTAAGEDTAGPEARFRRETASYMRVPAYERWLRGLGWGEVVDRALSAGSLQAMADSLPEGFVADMGLLGTPEGCLDRAARMAADGVTPLLVPITDPGRRDRFERVMRVMRAG